MSSVIDEKVVEMRFDNQKFEENVRTSLDTLERLKSGLNFENSEKSLDSLSRTANNLNLSNLEKNIQSIADRFSTTGIIGMKLITDITSLAERKIGGIVNKIQGMVATGGISRAMNIEKAKFQLEGLGVAWSQIEGDINYGVQDTAYGLDAAANVASQLVASNVQIGDSMKAALRGVSGVAAMTASSYEEIGSIFTTVAGQGKLMTMQLRQLESRGINAAATLGQQLGYSEAQIRDMVTAGEISFDDFSKAMDDAFGQHAKDANRTFTGVMSNIRSAFAKIGADFITPFVQNDGKIVTFLESIRANVNEFRKFIQSTSTSIALRIVQLVDNFRQFGVVFKESSGWTYVWENLKNILYDIASVLYPIGKAFGQLLPKLDGKALANTIKKFTEFTKALRLSEGAMQGLYSICMIFVNAIRIILAITSKVLELLAPVIKFLKNILDIVLRLVAYISTLTGPLDRVVEGIVGLINAAPVAAILEHIASALKTLAIVIAASLIVALRSLYTVAVNLKNLIQPFVESTLLPLIEHFKELASIKFANLKKQVGAVLNSIQMSDVLAKVLAVLEKIANAVRTVVSLLSKISSSALSKIVAVLSSLSKITFDDLKNGISGIKDSILSLINDVQNLGIIETIGGRLGSLITVASNVKDSIVGVFTSIGSAISVNIFGNVGEEYSEETTKIIEGNEEVVSSSDNFKSSMETITESFKSFVDTVKNFTSNIIEGIKEFGLAKAIILVMAGVMTINSWRMVTAFNTLSNAFLNLSGVISGGTILSKFQKKVKSFKTSASKLSSSIAILVGSLTVLAFIPRENLIQGGVALVVVAGLLASAAAIFSKIDTSGLTNIDKTCSVFTKAIFRFAVSVGVLAVALRLVQSSIADDPNLAMTSVLILIVGLMGGLAIISGLMAKFAPVLSLQSASLLSLAAAVLLLSISMKAIVKGIEAMGDAIKDSKLNFSFVENNIEQIIVIFGTLVALAVAARIAGRAAVMGAIAMVILSAFADKFVDGMKHLMQITRILRRMDSKILIKAAGIISAIALVAMMSAEAMSDCLKGAVAVAVLLGVVAGIAAIASYIVRELDDAELGKALGVMTVLTGFIAVLMLAIGATENAKPIAILSLVIIIGELVATMIMLAVVPIGTLIAVSTSLGAVLISFAVVCNNAAKIAIGVDTSALLMLAGTVVAIGFTLTTLAAYPWQSIAAAGAAMAGVLYIVARGIAQLAMLNNGNDLYNASMSMLMACVPIIAIGGMIATLTKYNWLDVAVSAASLSGALAALSGSLIILTNFGDMSSVITGAASLVIATASILGIAASLSLIATYDWLNIAVGAGGLAGVLAVLSGCLILMSKIGNMGILVGAVSLLIACPTILAIGSALSSLANYDWESIKAAILGLSAVLIVLTAVIAVLGALGEVSIIGVAVLAVGILALGFALSSFALAANGVAAVINAVTNALLFLSTVSAEQITNITTAITEITSSIGEGIGNMFGSIITIIGTAITTAITNLLSSLYSISPEFALIGAAWITGIATGFGSGILEAVAAVGIAFTAIKASAELQGAASSLKFFEIGKDLLAKFNNGVSGQSELGMIKTTISNLGTNAVNWLKKSVTGIPGVGKWIGVSFADGMSTTNDIVADAGTNLGIAAEESLRNQVQVHSRSPLFTLIGWFTGFSSAEGLESTTGLMGDAASAVGDAGVAELGSEEKQSLFAKAGEVLGGLFNGSLGETITNGVGTVKNWLSAASEKFDAITNGEGLDLDLEGMFADFLNTDDLMSQMEEATSGASALARSYDDLGTAASGAGSSAGSASSEVKKSTDIMDYAADVVLKYKDEYVKLTDELGDDQALEVSKSAVTDFAKAVYEAAGNTVDDTEDCMVKVLENFQTFQSDLTKSLRSQLSSLESFTQSYDISKWSIQSAFKTNKDAVAEWEKFVVDAARRGVNQDYLINIVQGGFSQESYNKVRTFKTMTLDEIADFNKAIVNANNYSSTNLMTRLVNAYAQGVNDLQETGEKWISSNGLTLDTVLSKLEEASVNYEQKLASMKDSLSGVATSFDELSEAAETSADDILKNLQDRGEALEAYAENISGLYNMNLDKSFMAYIESLGFEGRGTVQAMIDAGEDKIHEIEEQWLYNSERESSLAESLSATWTSQYIDGMTDTVQALGEALKDGQISEDVGGAWLDLAAKSMDTYWGGVANMSSENAAKYKELLSSNIKQTVGSEFIDNLMSTMPQESLVGQITNNLTEGISSDAVKQSISDSFQETWQYCIDHLADGSMSSESVASLLKSLADQIQQSAEVGGLDEASMGIVNNLVEGIRTFAASDITQSSLQETFGSLLEPLSEITKSQAAQEALQNMTVSVNQSVIDSLTDKSTLDSVEAAGGMLTLAFSEGVVKNIKLTDDASAEMSRGVVETSEGIISYEQFVAIAWHIIDGLVDGIYDGRSQVVTAMADMVREAVEAAEEEAEIESPSHVMYRIGNFIDQGLANGVADNSKSVVDATGKLSQETISAFDTVILSISDYLENGINAEPTITPVLDMTNMEEGLRYSNSMFASQNFKIGGLADRARAIADELNAKDSDSSTDNGQKAGNTYQFVQNNYSPKALSRLDIYRQTHNQFARMKGLVEA